MSKKVKNVVNYGSMSESAELKVIKEEYNKVGTQWKLVTTTEEKANRQFYINLVSAKRFFNNLGGNERHYKSYTQYGYLVTRINSVAPGSDKKVVYRIVME